ncbi:hypothetical protein BUALT_Bualt15G0113700 [Buddleja alternifolia]|uniref:Uncharacterized protein n=1 Tax=Buddleja alternifolia TaxID=168488 RepID=A0AAV6WKZ2_9LAMI|nr:hypothetical protein BUALT_Bualt15G0113700 [Buddleja alternifolia]
MESEWVVAKASTLMLQHGATGDSVEEEKQKKKKKKMMLLLDWFYGVLASLGLWQKEAKILFLGLDNAGKTTLLHMLKDEVYSLFPTLYRLVQHQPTQYPTSEELRSSRLLIWEAIRLPVEFGKIIMQSLAVEFDILDHGLVMSLIVTVDAVVYLVDSYDKERFPESKKELDALLCDESLADVPFLILGNKIDISEDELRYDMGLTGITTGKGKVNLADSNVRPVEVFMCSIVRKMGCGDGFKWVSQYIK